MNREVDLGCHSLRHSSTVLNNVNGREAPRKKKLPLNHILLSPAKWGRDKGRRAQRDRERPRDRERDRERQRERDRERHRQRDRDRNRT